MKNKIDGAVAKDVAQVVEYLLSMYEALGLAPSAT